MSFQSSAFQNSAFQVDPVVSGGTGGWGAGLHGPGLPTPLSKIKRVKDVEDTRRKSLEVLEAAINAAFEKIEARQEPTPLPIAIAEVPTIDWGEIETSRKAYADTKRQLREVLAELKAYELKLAQEDEEDVEMLLLA